MTDNDSSFMALQKTANELTHNGSTKEQFLKALSDGKQLMSCYRCAIMEIETKFRVLDDQFSLAHDRNPISSIQSRLKTPQSIYSKLTRRGLSLTIDAIENNIFDIAGVRVVCSFIDDIYMLSECLANQDDINVVEIKDYIKKPKPNGYRSLHMIVEVPIFLPNEKKIVKVEVQFRTIAMDFWANLEHQMRYKKNLPDEVLENTDRQLLQCAELSSSLDSQMLAIRFYIDDNAITE